MAFSMGDITALKEKRRGMIKQLFAIVNNDNRLTKVVKTAFNVYVDYMLMSSSTSKISVVKLKKDINRVLSFNCDKQAVLISKYDVAKVEQAIIVDVKKAIQLGGLEYLKYDKTPEEALQRAVNIMHKYTKEYEDIQNSKVDAFGLEIDKEKMKNLLSKLEVF